MSHTVRIPLFQTPGQLIRQLRRRRRLTLESLAWDAGMSTLALSNLERKDSLPRRESLISILDALERARPLDSARPDLLNRYGYADSRRAFLRRPLIAA